MPVWHTLCARCFSPSRPPCYAPSRAEAPIRKARWLVIAAGGCTVPEGRKGGDLTGDGVLDLLFGSKGASADWPEAGAVYVLPGVAE